MPRTKLQGIVFQILMSFLMAYGVQVYVISNRMGYIFTPDSTMTYAVFAEAAKRTAFMGIIAFVVLNLIGNKVGILVMNKYCNPGKDNPFFCRILRQAGTVLAMCPTMSLIAIILYQIIPGDQSIIQLPAIWVGTVMRNFPMAFFWNMFAVAPFVNWIFEKWNKHFSR